MFGNQNQYNFDRSAAVAAAAAAMSSMQSSMPAAAAPSVAANVHLFQENGDDWYPSKDRRSTVWQHLLANRNDPNVLKCRHCETIFKAHRSTSTYRYHMQHIHHLCIENIININSVDHSTSPTSNQAPPPSTQSINQIAINQANNNKAKLPPKPTTKFSKGPQSSQGSQHDHHHVPLSSSVSQSVISSRNNHKASYVAEVLAYFSAIDLISFRTLARSREFDKCWKSRNLSTQMPTTERAMFELVLNYATQCQLMLTRKLKQKLELDGERFTLSLDRWTSPNCISRASNTRNNLASIFSANNKRFNISINLHTSKEDEIYCLGAFRANSDTADKTVLTLQQRLLRFGIDLRKHIVAIVTDNSEPMRQIVWHTGIYHQPCFNHRIHRAMVDILYRPPAPQTSSSSNLTQRFKQESDLNNEEDQQEEEEEELVPNDDDDDLSQFDLIEEDELFDESEFSLNEEDETNSLDDSWLQQIRTYDSVTGEDDNPKNCTLAYLPVMDKVRNIFRIFLRSKRRREVLMKTYFVRMDKPLPLNRLRLDREMCWRSVLSMVKQFLDIQSMLRPILGDLSLGHLFPTNHELQFLVHLTQSLELVNVAVSALARPDCNLIKAGKIFEFLIRKLKQQQQQALPTNNQPMIMAGQLFCDAILKRVGERDNLLLGGLLKYLDDPYDYCDSIISANSGSQSINLQPSKDEITVAAKNIVSRMLLLDPASSSSTSSEDNQIGVDPSHTGNSGNCDDSKYYNSSILELLDICYQNNSNNNSSNGDSSVTFAGQDQHSSPATATTINDSSIKRMKYSAQTAADELQDFLSKKETKSKPKSSILPSNDRDTLEYIKREMMVLEHSKIRTDCLDRLYNILLSVRPTLLDAQKNSKVCRIFCDNLKIGIDVCGRVEDNPTMATPGDAYLQDRHHHNQMTQQSIIDRFCILRSYLMTNCLNENHN